MQKLKSKAIKNKATACLILENQYLRENIFTMLICKSEDNFVQGTPLELFQNQKLMKQLSREAAIRIAFMAGVESENSMMKRGNEVKMLKGVVS